MTKVITLLKDLKDKSEARTKKDEVMAEEFAVYCDDEQAARKNSIKEASREIEDLEAIIQGASAKIATSADIVSTASAEIAKNEEEIAAGSKSRAEEKALSLEAQQELDETINMISRAKTILKRSMSFAQGAKENKKEDLEGVVDALKMIIQASSTDINSKKKLESFVQSSEQSDDLTLLLEQPQAKMVGYESKSGDIVSVLEDMKDQAEEQLHAAREAEMSAAHAWAMMEQNLQLANKALAEKVKDAQGVSQAASAEKAQAEKDLAVQKDSKSSDESFLGQLVKNCKTKAQEWSATQKAQAQEIKAISEAIDVLSAKFALVELKTVTQHTSSDISEDARSKAAKILKKLGRKYNSFALMEVAAAAQQGDVFEKVRGLITDMIAKLQKQAQEEATKKAFCDEETKKSAAKRDDRMAAVEKHQTRLDKATSGKAKLEEEIVTLNSELSEMAEALAKMTKLRTEEKTEFDKQSKELAESEAAVQGAIQVLREYYGASGTALLQQKNKQPEGPEFGSPSASASTQILGILEQAAEDFGVQLAEAKAAETEAANDYEAFKQKSAVSKASKEASVKGKENEVKGLTELIQIITGDKESVSAELDAVLEYIEKLKPQCTQKIETYEERAAKREAEISGLKEALEILAADGAFIQKKAFLSTRK